MISQIGANLNPYSYGFSAGAVSGKLYVPVSPSAVVYAQFDNISGVAARRGERGVSLNKIQILNSLINQMHAMKNEPRQESRTIDDSQVDAMIENLQRQIQSAASAAPFALSGVQPQTGIAFSIDA